MNITEEHPLKGSYYWRSLMRNGNSIQWIESSGHNAYLIALMAHHLELMNSIDCRWILRFIPHLDSPMFVPAAHRSDTLSKRDPLLRPKLSVYVQIGSPHIVNAIRHWDEHLKEQLNDHLLCTVNLALESLGSELFFRDRCVSHLNTNGARPVCTQSPHSVR